MAPRPQLAAQLLAADQTRIADIMTRDVITVRADLSQEQLVELFLDQNLSRVPVVDDNGRLIGVVSKTDLVIAQHERGDTEVSQAGAGGRDRHVHEVGGIVRDIMTPIAFTLPETTSIGEAARRMLADMAWVAGAQFPQASSTGAGDGPPA
jgi:CBS domain-containing protein